MFEIKKVQLSNLISYVNSEEYKILAQKPISPARAISYVNNPRASGDENVLYMIFDDRELIAFRSLLVDNIYIDSQCYKVAWFSGSWVAPSERRQGLSTKMQNEILKDWDGQLLFANYAESSKKLYDKTGLYKAIHEHKGIRFYRRLSFKELLTPKSKYFKRIAGLLGIMDTVFNAIADLRFAEDKPFMDSDYALEEIEDFNEEHIAFLEKSKGSELFKRGQKEYDWIKSYPWVAMDNESKEIQLKYHFSTYSNSFYSRFYCLRGVSNKNILGMVMLNVNDGKLTIPYIYMEDKGYKTLSKFILNLCNRHNVKYITCYDSKLIEELYEEEVLLFIQEAI